MKNFLRYAALFVSGFIIGGAIVGYLSLSYAKETIQRQMADSTLTEISNDIILLESYRNDAADRFFKMVEDGIPGYVVMIDQNEEMKKSNGQGVLKSAKSFYLCTNTPVPKNIEKIIEDVKLSPDSKCFP